MPESLSDAVYHAITILVYVGVFAHFRTTARDFVRESGRIGHVAVQALGVALIVALFAAPAVGSGIAGPMAETETFRGEDYFWAGFVALALILFTAVGMGVVEGRRPAVVRTFPFSLTLQDSQHRRWSVGDIFADKDFSESLYLEFRSGADVRRLAPCPVGWSMLTAEGLEYLLSLATPVTDAEAEARRV